MAEEIKVRGKGIAPLVSKLRVRVNPDAFSGLEMYHTTDIAGQEFDVVALAMHPYDDRTATAVAWLDTPAGLREMALKQLIVVKSNRRPSR